MWPQSIPKEKDGQAACQLLFRKRKEAPRRSAYTLTAFQPNGASSFSRNDRSRKCQFLLTQGELVSNYNRERRTSGRRSPKARRLISFGSQEWNLRRQLRRSGQKSIPFLGQIIGPELI
ncbi:glutamate--tRNA ligase [Striga asiatica]|uniref:Glutamate--tRNA ligase n=1 Tax=Striga asiatica TaxID=4170 RepID=A0A5A7Q1U2_STRAF|nr:glutamate--tRNA ligase [Striga asiatica]